jgi:hypothetical protein
VDDGTALEAHLREAPIDLYGTFEARGGGGGHPDKQLVVVRGGIGALAKLVRNETEQRQCQAEVGAWLVARAMGAADLVPTTVYREVPTADGLLAASVQVLWPAFLTAGELGITEQNVPDRDGMRVAVLDALLQNGDRNTGNWGMVASAKLGLIDHGNTGLSGMPGQSPFTVAWRDRNLDSELSDHLERLAEDGVDGLADLVDHQRVAELVQRAREIVDRGAVVADA